MTKEKGPVAKKHKKGPPKKGKEEGKDDEEDGVEDVDLSEEQAEERRRTKGSSQPSTGGGGESKSKGKEKAGTDTGSTTKTRRGGRRSRRKNQIENEKVVVKDAGLEKMIAAVARLSLQGAYGARLAAGGVLDVCIGPEDNVAARAVATEGEAYSEQIEELHSRLAKARTDNNN